MGLKARKCKNPGKRARTKGHSFEREVAQALRVVFPKARRHLEYQDGECFGVDLAETGIFRFQCKRGVRYAPLTALSEIQYDAFLGEIPVLVTKGDGLPALVALPLEDFISLLEAWYPRE